MKIIELVIKRKITTAMIFSGICLIGIISATKLRVELLPDIDLPTLTVITPFENAAPSEVEKLVTARIEEAVTSVSGVSGVTSESIDGMSIVKVSFEWERDMDMALIGVKEKVDLIRGELPEDTGKSIVVRYDTADEPVMIYSVSLDNGDFKNIRKRAEKEIAPFLERINGVSLVELLGGDKREILVEVDNASLYSKNLSLPEIVQNIGLSNYSYPAGSLVKDGKEYLVRTAGEFRNCEDIRSVVTGYSENGVPVYLSDVAVVSDTFKERKSAVRFNGEESVALLVKKEPGKNTIMTCESVRNEMRNIASGRKSDFNIKCIYDQSVFIQSSIDNVLYSAILGGVISFFVIWFFLKNIIPPLIISLSIPVSIAGTMVLMKIFDISLNTMSLGGLAVGTGMMVDAGIVVLESIQDFKDGDKSLSDFDAAVKGTLDVAAPVTASVLTSVIVFLPIVFLSGLSGAVFRDLALTVSFSLMLSLLSSLTLIPMLSGLHIPSDSPLRYALHKVMRLLMKHCYLKAGRPYSLSGGIKNMGNISDKVMRGIDSFYESILCMALAERKKVIISGCTAMVTGFVLFTFIDSELMPSVDPGEFSIEIELPGGTPLAETSGLCETFENYINGTGNAEYVFTKAGCDPDDNISEKISGRGSDYALIKVFMKKSNSAEKFISELKGNLKFNDRVKITYRMKEDIVASVFSAGKSKTDVEIYGIDEADLKESGNSVKDMLAKLNGLQNISSVFDRESPELRVDIDRKSAASLGLNADEAASQLGMAVRGEVSSSFRDGDDEIGIRVRLLKKDRTGADSLNRIIVKTSSGVTVPLSKFAEIKSGTGSGRIVRREQSRINIVSADIIPGGGFISETLRDMINKMKFRDGVLCKVADGSDQIKEAFGSLGFAMILAVIFIYMLLAGQFQSLKNPLIIMISIPVTALGVSLALLITGQSLNINSGIGMILLSGTVVNNAIVLFDFVDKECANGMSVKTAVIEAGRRRLKPILMTTLTTILALVPIAFGMGEGAELQRPLAVTVIGGMTVSTLLTLVFIPAVFSAINEDQTGVKAEVEIEVKDTAANKTKNIIKRSL
ncbi:MAG TPA: efflux RND transporter permease subunit [Spirochaetota bacterium]|nr:efflux RND transporter permease subunit [Spirochaetota bacterium]